ncbi:TonB-dependent receptor domain-containing protein [Parasediminibacterium sp. JCM 36343]|uniref:TonB-dependent receptor domain-containing protein n=1 Tax=Parasediminibacterium sp. JCM 36343 TaxID=3374279 RepID=UPI00397D4C0D
MKKQFYLFTLLFSLFAFKSFSQNKNSITGFVQDNGGKPLAAVTISLLKAKDSSLIKAGISDKDGSFELSTNREGSFLLSYTIVGFEKKFSPVFELGNGKTTYAAPKISLAIAQGKLQEVTVSAARKPLIEVKADKMVFNVENSINATGSDAMELLQKSPGVQVDNNDNISMKGKTGVRVYVDGKMLQLDSKDLAAYLKSINSNDIEAIEMISNPSAKYDASGNAGIINIRLKKNKKYGTNGTATLGFVQGVTPKGNGSLNLNYRDKKINLFSNVSGNIGDHQNTMNLYRTQKDSIYDQHSTNVNDGKSINAKAGADFFINSKNTFGVMARIGYDDNVWTSNSHTDICTHVNSPDSFVKTLAATNRLPSKRTNVNTNINYRFADTSGTEVNADADYGFFSGRGNSYQPNTYIDRKNIFTRYIYANNTPTDIDIYTAKVDVEMNRWKGKLGFGAKFSYVKTKNTFDFFNVDPLTNAQSKALDRSNNFTYKENVNAGYINYQRQINAKFSIQTGLRIENTNSVGDLTRADGTVQTDGYVPRNYTNLFPSAAITWNVNKKNTLNLTYSRRIDRPTYQDLNPFENKLDELTYEKGNAKLKPQYTDNIELTHTFMGFLNTTTGYSHVSDYATQITDTVGNATYVEQQNLATQQIISFSIGSPLPIKKWWNGYVNFWYNYQIFDGHINDKPVHQEIPMYGAYLQNTFKLGHDYTAEMSGWFNGPSIWGATWRTKPQGGIDVGIQKQLLDKKASIKLSATDILHTAPWKANSNFGGMVINGGGAWESTTVRLNFTYRFGSNQIKASRERKTGLESESQRIKGGGN